MNTDDSFVGRGFAPVPLIDISPFALGDAAARGAVAREVGDACEGIGFMMVTGHGVDPALIADFYRVSHRFFELPIEQKMRAASPHRNRFQGYAAPGTEAGAQISERQSFNVQGFDSVDDAIAAGYPDDAGTSLFPAVWPEQPAEFRDVWVAYYAAMEGLTHRLLAVFDHALGLPDGWFQSRIEHHHSSLVANYYSFDIDSGRDPSPFRFKAHVDGSILTILYQDDGPGSLQLHQRGKGWRDVKAVEGAFVVNLGELMARWTNDRFVATPHRVLRPPETEREPRLSVPFFLKPGHETVVAPIPELIADGATPAYEPVTGREWLNGRQRNEYDSAAAFAEVAELDPILR